MKIISNYFEDLFDVENDIDVIKNIYMGGDGVLDYVKGSIGYISQKYMWRGIDLNEHSILNYEKFYKMGVKTFNFQDFNVQLSILREKYVDFKEMNLEGDKEIRIISDNKPQIISNLNLKFNDHICFSNGGTYEKCIINTNHLIFSGEISSFKNSKFKIKEIDLLIPEHYIHKEMKREFEFNHKVPDECAAKMKLDNLPDELKKNCVVFFQYDIWRALNGEYYGLFIHKSNKKHDMIVDKNLFSCPVTDDWSIVFAYNNKILL